jgi:glycosyl transferase family 4
MPGRLTVLITNIAFAFRSGTEIVIDQLARGLNARGHRPIVFAPYVGGTLAAGLRLIGIAVVDRLSEVGATPDIIHGQHNVTTVMALAAFPRTPALFCCHDFDAPKDRAPIVPRIRRYLAVDECCRERLERDGVPKDRIEVVYNAVDLDQYRRRGPLPRRPERALVLTKGAEHLEVVRSAAAAAGLTLDELGSGAGAVVGDLPARLPAYDIVIATARMAKEAIAAGCAVVVCDHRGFAGLATSETVAEWRRYNFGRRILAQPPTEARLADAFARYDAEDAARVTDFVRAEDDLGSHIDRMERIYQAILDDPGAIDSARDLEALAPFLEDFLISRDFSRPWAELYRNVTEDESDLMEEALSRHTGKLRADILQGLDHVVQRVEQALADRGESGNFYKKSDRSTSET